MNNDIDYLIDQKISGRTLIFDLDNTLYNEFDFLKQQYFLVSRFFCPDEIEIAYDYLVSTFLSEGRGSLFNKFQEHFNLEYDISSVLECFRTYSSDNLGSLKCYAWFLDLLKHYDGDESLIIITNGNVLQQQEKIKRLNLNEIYGNTVVIYANDHSPKPDRSSYDFLSNCQLLNKPIYIGDSIVDFNFSKNCDLEYFDVNRLNLN
ncbi:HAD family hydrolase [Vibrio crassostreae]|uniref:HAD family hydrolase n=1 Tax=Vibrio crassostreae TaxID=246167 RepID=UPI0010CF7351|nr:HAD hydrolase-like protein [Vibrio crassostreae]TCV26775.1 putative hydrolase of the HAD superfamily [Vibrio crassostreae]